MISYLGDPFSTQLPWAFCDTAWRNQVKCNGMGGSCVSQGAGWDACPVELTKPLCIFTRMGCSRAFSMKGSSYCCLDMMYAWHEVWLIWLIGGGFIFSFESRIVWFHLVTAFARLITSSTAQGGGGSFKNRKRIGDWLLWVTDVRAKTLTNWPTNCLSDELTSWLTDWLTD